MRHDAPPLRPPGPLPAPLRAGLALARGDRAVHPREAQRRATPDLWMPGPSRLLERTLQEDGARAWGMQMKQDVSPGFAWHPRDSLIAGDAMDLDQRTRQTPRVLPLPCAVAGEAAKWSLRCLDLIRASLDRHPTLRACYRRHADSIIDGSHNQEEEL